MLIGVRNRFVFVANPKSGSTSIESALRDQAEIWRGGSPQRKHTRWSVVRKEYAFLFDQPAYAPRTFFRFGVIREPADWIRSWYNYRLGLGQLAENPAFEQFWKRPDWVKKISQIEYFTEGDDRCTFDLLIPQEHLDEALPLVCRRLGLKMHKTPHRNVSRNPFARDQIPARLADEINAHYAGDFAAYRQWKHDFRTVLETATQAVGEEPAADAPGKAPGPKPQIIEPPNPAVCSRRMELTPISATPRSVLMSCAGFIALSPEQQPGTNELLVRGQEMDERALDWGHPSPAVARANPGNPNAARARFRPFRLELAPGALYSVVLRDSVGRTSPVFDIRC